MRRYLLAICFSMLDLQNVECKAFCRFYAGYDSGRIIKSKCYCLEEVDVNRLQEKTLFLPHKRIKKESEDTRFEYNPSTTDSIVPYKLPWEVS
jgi:hypothetical protein